MTAPVNRITIGAFALLLGLGLTANAQRKVAPHPIAMLQARMGCRIVIFDSEPAPDEDYDNPRIVVYDDGTALFRIGTTEDSPYYRAVLSASRFADIEQRVEAALRELERPNRGPWWPTETVPPVVTLYMSDGTRSAETTISGSQTNPEERPNGFAPELYALWQALEPFDEPSRQPYTPAGLEVSFWKAQPPLDEAAGTASESAWPKDWPAPHVEDFATRSETHVVVPGSALDRAWETIRDRVLLFDGLRLRASYKILLPGRAAWEREMAKARGD